MHEVPTHTPPRTRLALVVLLLSGVTCRTTPEPTPPTSTAGSTDASTSASSMPWRPCDPPVPKAECATMMAPLSYDDPSAGEIAIALMRIPSEAPSGRQLWYLAGGPGGAGTSLLPLLQERYGAAWRGVDLYTLDHRGTGGSSRLSCPAQEAPGSPGDTLLAPQEIEPCVAWLEQEVGPALPHLSVTASARDLGAAIDVLREDSRVYLWGNSFGTYWAQRFVQLFPEATDGVFLEALVPAEASYRSFDYWMNDTGMRLMQRCADEPACRERFAEDPVALARALPARLAKGHCAALGLPVPISWFLGSLLYDHDLRGMVPLLVHMLDRCHDTDVRRLRAMYGTLFEDRGMLTAGDFCAPLHIHVVLSELWGGRSPDGRSLDQIANDCLFCPADRAWLDRARAGWPTYAPAPWNAPWDDSPDAPPDAPSNDHTARYRGPLWMLQGGLDPATPPNAAAQMKSHFRGVHQHTIIFPTGAHTLTGKTRTPTGDCALALLHAFLEDPTQDPFDCADQVAAPRFTQQPDRLTEALLGPGDPWRE